MTSPILRVLPSLLVKNMVFCPEFVTDMDMGVITGGRCSTGADDLADGGPVDTEGDVVGTGGATGFGARELGGSWKWTPETLCLFDCGVEVEPLAKVTLSHSRLSSTSVKSSSTSEHDSPSDDELSKITMYLDLWTLHT